MAVHLYRSVRHGLNQVRQLARTLCTSTIPTTPKDGNVYEKPKPLEATISLTESLPNFPQATYVKNEAKESSGKTQITTLSNGLRVATEPKFGQFCTVGVCIDSGARYEVAYPSGVSHFLEKLAFGVTEKFSSKDEIMRRLEEFGGICDCQSTRDTFLYAASVDSRGKETFLKVHVGTSQLLTLFNKVSRLRSTFWARWCFDRRSRTWKWR